MRKQTTKNYTKEDFQELLVENLLKCTDVELVILKGHVLIEYTINHFIESNTNESIEFDSSKFTFAQKLHLFKLLGECKTELYENIELFNKLRNEIAHKLEYNQQHLGSFLSNVGKIYSLVNERKKEDKIQATKIAVAHICGIIVGHNNRITEKKKIAKEIINNTNK